MADPLITLGAALVSVQPGSQARVDVTVTNVGDRVEGYRLQVLGIAASWAQVVPPELSVYPQQKASAAVLFIPPAGSSIKAGRYPFGVLALSTLDPESSRAAEGDLDVVGAISLNATIVPVNSKGSRSGQHRVELTNTGNSAASLRLMASDPDEELLFHLSPSDVVVPPGGQLTVRVVLRPKHKILRGQPVRLPFQVAVQPVEAEPPSAWASGGEATKLVVYGAFNQSQVLTNGRLVLLILLILAVLVVVLWIFSQ